MTPDDKPRRRRARRSRRARPLALALLATASAAACIDLEGLGSGLQRTDDGGLPADGARDERRADAASRADADCGDTLRSQDHCGACGHACVEAACVEGLCEARTVATVSPPVNRLRALGSSVYFTTDLGIYRCPGSGCAATGPEALATGAAQYTGLAVDPKGVTAVAITDIGPSQSTGAVVRCPLIGACSSPSVIAAQQENPEAVESAEDVVWWGRSLISGIQADVARCPVTGCDGGERTVSGLLEAVRSIIARDAVYIASAERIFRAPLGGGPATLLASTATGALVDMVANRDTLFWGNIENRSVEACPASAGCGTGRRFIATSIGRPRALAADDRFVYIAADGADGGGGSRILRCETNGCESLLVLARTIRPVLALTLDTAYLYWAEGDGASGVISRVAK